jgi:ParB/RepB/Spo0J family partition protein
MLIQYTKEHIHNNPHQTRQLDQARVEQIELSIREHDLLQPPVGRKHPTIPGDAELAMGHHRSAAWFQARPNEPLTIDIRELTDKQMAEYAIIENNDRADLKAIEKAAALKRYMEDFGVKQEDAGKLFGLKTQGAVSNLLRLLQLPASVQDLVRDGKLPERHARTLLVASKMDAKKTAEIAKKAVEQPADEVDEFLTEQVERTLNRSGRRIDTDLIDIDKQEETGRPACRTCPHFLRASDDLMCGKTECYDSKVQRALNSLASLWTAKHNVPLAKPGEKVEEIHVGYEFRPELRKAITARLAVLRIKVAGRGGYENQEITGSEYIELVTTDNAALEKFLRSNSKSSAALKVKAEAGKKLSPKEAKALQAAQEKERAARAKERSLSNRIYHDVAWMIESASAWLGAGMKVFGGASVFFQKYVNRHAYVYSDWESAREFLQRMEREYKVKPDEANRRRWIAAMLITDNHTAGVNGQHFGSVAKRIERLADEFGVRPPKNWKRPPIHRTNHNCWKCGVFGSQPDRLTKGELAAGWTVKAKGKAILDVRCPDCGKDVCGNG